MYYSSGREDFKDTRELEGREQGKEGEAVSLGSKALLLDLLIFSIFMSR